MGKPKPSEPGSHPEPSPVYRLDQAATATDPEGIRAAEDHWMKFGECYPGRHFAVLPVDEIPYMTFEVAIPEEDSEAEEDLNRNVIPRLRMLYPNRAAQIEPELRRWALSRLKASDADRESKKTEGDRKK